MSKFIQHPSHQFSPIPHPVDDDIRNVIYGRHLTLLTDADLMHQNPSLFAETAALDLLVVTDTQLLHTLGTLGMGIAFSMMYKHIVLLSH